MPIQRYRIFKALKALARPSAVLFSLCFSGACIAAVYDGPGIGAGVNSGDGGQSLRSFIETVLRVALSYVALAAVVMIVIAGIMFIFSGGNDETKNKAVKIIIYTIVGIIIILLASAFVWFLVNLSDGGAQNAGLMQANLKIL